MERESGGILALDLATSTGFAVAQPGKRTFSGTVPFNTERRPERLHRYDAWLDDQLGFHKPQILVWEAPVITGVPGSADRALLTLGMSAITEMAGFRHQIAVCEMVHNATVKLFFAGHGHAKKEQMIAKAIALGFNPQSTDEADAIGVLYWAANKHRMPLKDPKS